MEQSLSSTELDSDARRRQDVGATVPLGRRSAAISIRRQIVGVIRNLRDRWRSETPETLDIELLSDKLRIEERARTDGGVEQPPSAEEVVTGTQREIVSYFKVLQRKAQRKAVALADKMRKCAAEIDMASVRGQLRDIPADCESELLRINAQFEPQLRVLEERAVLQRKSYESFRERNQLNRPADYPPSPILPYALLALLIAGGALIVGKASEFWLSGAASFSPIGSVSVSLVIALAAFTFGVWFRAVNHARTLRRLGGWLAGATGLLSILALSTFIAYYTTMAAGDPGVELGSVPRIAWSNPGIVGTELSIWVVPAVVLVLGLAAFSIGYKSDDTYPGYGDVQRAFYRARDQYDVVAGRLRKRSHSVIDAASAKMATLLERLTLRVKQHARLMEDSKRVPAALNDYDIILEDACNILLDRYRAINRRYRQSAAPESFSEHISFRLEREPMADTFSDQSALAAEYREGFAELEKCAAEARRRLKDLNWRTITPLTESAEST